MTKQQAISLHLAKWLGLDVELCREPNDTATGWYEVVAFPCGKRFNPFSPTTEGRAQFAECVIKAGLAGNLDIWSNRVYADCGRGIYKSASIVLDEESLVFTTLEAIYLATGGQPGQWEEP